MLGPGDDPEDGRRRVTQAVLVRVEGAVAEIRFNRPEALNALDLSLAHALSAAVDRVIADAAVRVVVLSGEGRAFMAGGDLNHFRTAGRSERPERSRELIGPASDALARLTESRLPTIACVNGAAAGAGMSIALMTDLAIAADDAKFNLSYVKVGANPDCGGSFALVRLVGLRRAMEIALLSDTLDAQAALSLGLVNRVVPAGELREAGLAMARRLADGAPLALASTKALLRRASGGWLREQLDAECEGFARLSGTDDFDEALEAFFTKRKPTFAGR